MWLRRVPRSTTLAFARPAAEAIRRHRVAHVVAVSSAGHAWPARAGVLSAAFAMDAEISRTGAAYRALSPPFFMENLLGQVAAIREHGMFSLANAADRSLATVATRDIGRHRRRASRRSIVDRPAEPTGVRA
jgi:uncharacterized protein YbjT (DUF2867 family)